jgi:hypothetical protein
MKKTTTSSQSTADLASTDHPALVSRSWNGTPISRRTSDGYVNVTAMCKANGKQWSKYRESDRCQTYLDALAETSEIRMFDLIESRQGQGGGTWVHPQVAVDLARWISAPFAVWMDGWFLESIQQALPRSQFCATGKLVARAYRDEFGEEPPRRQQFVDGAPRQIKSYRLSWLIDTLKRLRAQLGGG